MTPRAQSKAGLPFLLCAHGVFGVLPVESDGHHAKLLKIAAPLACYWLGRSELESAKRGEDEQS